MRCSCDMQTKRMHTGYDSVQCKLVQDFIGAAVSITYMSARNGHCVRTNETVPSEDCVSLS